MKQCVVFQAVLLKNPDNHRRRSDPKTAESGVQ